MRFSVCNLIKKTNLIFFMDLYVQKNLLNILMELKSINSVKSNLYILFMRSLILET